MMKPATPSTSEESSVAGMITKTVLAFVESCRAGMGRFGKKYGLLLNPILPSRNIFEVEIDKEK